MTHYFIDTENVGKRMSDLTDSLQTGDIIHMFYTDLNAGMNVTMRMLGTITQTGARVETIYCVCGSPNALDFQLVSFLSSMLNKKDKFVIYAYDTGYDAVCQFWMNLLQTSPNRLPSRQNGVKIHPPPSLPKSTSRKF